MQVQGAFKNTYSLKTDIQMAHLHIFLKNPHSGGTLKNYF